MADIRYGIITNSTPAAAAGLTSALLIDGTDLSLKAISRTLASSDNNNHGDIGTGVGQTRDNRGGGAPGCLIFQTAGALILDVLNFSVFRPVVAGGRTFYRRIDGAIDGAAAHHSIYQWSLSTDKKSLYIFDLSAHAASYLAGGDILKFLVVTGNQPLYSQAN